MTPATLSVLYCGYNGPRMEGSRAAAVANLLGVVSRCAERASGGREGE